MQQKSMSDKSKVYLKTSVKLNSFLFFKFLFYFIIANLDMIVGRGRCVSFCYKCNELLRPRTI